MMRIVRKIALFVFSIATLLWLGMVLTPVVSSVLTQFDEGFSLECPAGLESNMGFLIAPAHQHVPLYTATGGKQLGEMQGAYWIVPRDVKQGWVNIDPDNRFSHSAGKQVGKWVHRSDLTHDLQQASKFSIYPKYSDRRVTVTFIDVDRDGMKELLYEKESDDPMDDNEVYIYRVRHGKPTVLLDLASFCIITRVKMSDGTLGFTTYNLSEDGLCYRLVGDHYQRWRINAPVRIPTAKSPWAKLCLVTQASLNRYQKLLSPSPIILLLLLVLPFLRRRARRQ